MRTIESDQILRINCPGYGQESSFVAGKSKSLDNYKVLIVNPTSILHLFPKEPEALQATEAAQSEGLTSHNLDSDALLKSLDDEITGRTEELVQFLENGGLLVFFLCRPFILQGPQLSLDNYAWLLSLSPDQSTERNKRHMSAVARGRNIEPAEGANESEFFHYFSQPGLEWSTLIRTDFLTEGYCTLATAGPKKCIAGELFAGDNGGRIVFLPAPYSPDFDRTLMECVHMWYLKKQGLSPTLAEVAASVAQFTQASKGEAQSAPKAKDLLAAGSKDFKKKRDLSDSQSEEAPEKPLVTASASLAPKRPILRPNASPLNPRSAEPVLSGSKKSGLDTPFPSDEFSSSNSSNLTMSNSSAVMSDKSLDDEFGESSKSKLLAGTGVQTKTPEQDYSKASTKVDEFSGNRSSDLPPLSRPSMLERAQAAVGGPRAMNKLPELDEPATSSPTRSIDLSRMKQPLYDAATPDWCRQFAIPGLEKLKAEQNQLTEQIKTSQTRLDQLTTQLNKLETFKNQLLTAESRGLFECCQSALASLGWSVKHSDYGDQELILSCDDAPEAICRITQSKGQPQSSDLAELAKSMIAFWDQYEREPKGILICATWVDKPLSERKESDYTASFIQFAEKKNICLVSTIQLLSIYRDLDLNKATTEETRKALLQTNGALAGFNLV